ELFAARTVQPHHNERRRQVRRSTLGRFIPRGTSSSHRKGASLHPTPQGHTGRAPRISG
ncbi:hypothetical protein QOT17_025561, partial [Balamuthia mandrillaris]